MSSRRPPPGGHLAVLDDPLGHRCRDALGDLLLDREHVLDGSVVPLRPEMGAGRGIDELGGDAHAVAGAADAALDHVAGAERAADLAHVRALAAEGERGVAGDHHEVAEARELRDDVLGDAVAEVGLFRIAAHVVERQHRDRGLVGQGRRRPRPETEVPSSTIR